MSIIPFNSDYVLVPIVEEEYKPITQLVSTKIGESIPWTSAEKRKCICGSIGIFAVVASLAVIVYIWVVVVTNY